MHYYKPNQRVKVITLQIAVPANLDENEIADGIISIMTGSQNEFLLDWRYKDPKKQVDKIVTMSKEPEEGEAFLLPPVKMKKFSVCVTRTASAHQWIEVDAENEKEAGDRAVDMAKSVDFSGCEDGEPSYDIDETKEKQ